MRLQVGSKAPAWSTDLRLRQADVLQCEVEELRKENKHLREVLRILLAPPVYKGELPLVEQGEEARQKCRDLLLSMEEQVKQQDGSMAEIMAAQEQLRQQHQNAVMAAIAKWSGHGAHWLLREVFSAWRTPLQLSKQSRRHSAQLQAARAKLQPAMARLLLSSAESDARCLLTAWLNVARSQRLEIETTQRRQAKIQSLLLGWTGEVKVLQAICFQSWQRCWRDVVEEKRQEKLRREHMEVAATMKRDAVRSAMFALSSSQSKETEDMTLRIVLLGWRDTALAERKARAQEAEVERMKAVRERVEAQAKRQCMLVMVQAEQGQLVILLGAWKDLTLQARQARLLDELKYLQWAWRAWQKDFEDGRTERQLAQEQDRVAALEAAALEQRRQQHKARDIGLAFSIITKSEAQQQTLQLQLIWSAWLETVKDSKLSRDREKELQEMRRVMEVHEGEMQKQQRGRAAALAWAAAGQSDACSQDLLLQTVLSAWKEFIREVHRARSLDDKQALYEYNEKLARLRSLDSAKRLQQRALQAWWNFIRAEEAKRQRSCISCRRWAPASKLPPPAVHGSPTAAFAASGSESAARTPPGDTARHPLVESAQRAPGSRAGAGSRG
eukprot:CAMPEP_0178373820 /NCGR_PEP_ID=MMETSP0689_2-20121128/2059_1 /TAXON_ID=160604 /ORGANISM="Amphidinium massartii, Strain CS-259" /LENGTH=613 /DNA_ID=CAMNT_0019993773 /DNA_START=33 /DNA_END=1871 /DNA_ORIENTATION=-